MADLVKKGRGKVTFAVGDCVSVAPDYFGSDYESLLQDAKVHRLFGRVEVVEAGGNLTIRWDIDNELTYHIAPWKVYAEEKTMPVQTIPDQSIITIEDLQMADQSSSRDNEMCVPVCFIDKHVLFTDEGDHFEARLVTTELGTPVHHVPLAEGEGKFLITSILDGNSWSSFDDDIHSEGAFIRWKLDNARDVGKETDEKKDKKKFQLKIKGKKISERIASQEKRRSPYQDESESEILVMKISSEL